MGPKSSKVAFEIYWKKNPRKVLKDFDPVVPLSSELNSSSILPSIFTLDLSQFNFVLEKSFQFNISIIIHLIIKPNYIKCVRLTKPVNKLLTIFKYQKKKSIDVRNKSSSSLHDCRSLFFKLELPKQSLSSWVEIQGLSNLVDTKISNSVCGSQCLLFKSL